ncbi:MAG: hypothetical protein R3195_00305 [Gemmatimonadota bacterium]|nr:hypothetical protein [Gemmatimonadota bacterium]
MTPERSYSDREVALVLRRAVEIETTAGGAGGVAESEIVEIAREAGIGSDAVRRALDELEASASVSGSSFFPPASRRATHETAAALDRVALSRLVGAIEDRVGEPGAVTEALDTVRWTSRSSAATTQVTVSQADGRLRVGVHERVNDRARRLMYILPTNLVAMGALVTAGSLGVGGPGLVGILVAGGLAGLAAGREVARVFSRRSAERVERLAAAVATDAGGMESE